MPSKSNYWRMIAIACVFGVLGAMGLLPVERSWTNEGTSEVDQNATVLSAPDALDDPSQPAIDPNDPLLRAILQQLRAGRENLLDASPPAGSQTPAQPSTERQGETSKDTSAARWKAAELILKAARLIEQSSSDPLDKNRAKVQQLRSIAKEILLSN